MVATTDLADISNEGLAELAADIAELFDDLPSFGGFVQIKTQRDGKVPFGWDQWHPEQRRFERQRTGRDIVLKPRQIGFSTLELLRDFQFALVNEGVQVVVVVHTGPAKTELFAAVHLMARSLEAWGLLPAASENTKTGLRFENDSSIKVIEAGKDETTADDRGRSGTIHRLHVTECAFYRAPGATMTALLAAAKHAEVVIESTANGVGNWFHTKFIAARAGRFAGFTAHFFAWFEHPSHRVDPSLFAEEPKTARERHWEKRLRGLGCDDEQIAWWRSKIEENTLDKALREYPPTEDAAFEASGDTWLEPEHLDRLEARIRPPIEHWPVVRPQRKHRDGKVSAERRFAALRVFETPVDGEAYIVAGDPSGGVGRDNAAIAVMHHRTGRIVAAWDNDRTKPGDFGNVLALIGRRYNTALVACEIQLDGRAGRESLAVLEREERYPRIFAHKPGATGWSTDEVTRPLLFGDFGKAVEDGLIWTPDAKTVSEVRSLVADPKTGKVRARGKGTKSGSDDGLAVAWAIALQVRARSRMPGPRIATTVGKRSSVGFRT